MRVLHVAESAQGGVGSYLAFLAPLQIATLGRENVRILAPREHLHQLGASADGATGYHRGARSIPALLRLAAALREEVRRRRPDIIHAHSTFAGLVARLLHGGRGGPRVVYCPHGWAFDMEGSAARRRALGLLERWLSRRCDAVVAVSAHEQRQALGVGVDPARVALVPNGAPDTAGAAGAAAWDGPRLRVLFVGRLDRQKGLDVLLEAVRPLAATVDVRVVGAAVADAPALAAPLAHVTFLGWRTPDEIAAQMAAADVVAAPSRWEAFGLVAIEAMRAGRPVIASDVGGLSEIVRDGETGRLVPPGSPEHLRAALGRDDAAARAAMGAAGRRRFLSCYTMARVEAELRALYAAVLQRRAAA